MRSKNSVVFAILLIAMSGAVAQTVYKSVGPDGKIIYSDTPPAGNAPKYNIIQTSKPAAAQESESSTSANSSDADTFSSRPYRPKKPLSKKQAAAESAQTKNAASSSDGLTHQGKTWNELRKESSALFMQRDFAGALEAEKQAMAIAEKTSPNDPRIIKSLHAMATLNRMQGNNAQAISLYQRAVTISDRGPTYPQIAAIFNDLADACKDVGRESEAKKYKARAAEARGN